MYLRINKESTRPPRFCTHTFRTANQTRLMKSLSSNRLTIRLLAILGLLGNCCQVSATSVTLTTGTSWTAPAGVTTVQVECWGGGGAGGSASRGGTGGTGMGGGGGGGAYAIKTITVVPGNSYAYSIGSAGAAVAANSSSPGGNGGDTYFIDISTVLAKGGTGGASAVTSTSNVLGAGGAGGNSSSCVGDSAHSGGNGATATSSTFAGQGGGSGGTTLPGNNGVAATGGETAAVAGGGPGGAPNVTSGSSGPGHAPTTGPGGGGGGARGASAAGNAGGAGAAGQIVLTYTSVAPKYLYRSRSGASGNWTDANVWECNDGAGGLVFTNTTTPPDSTIGTNITIVSGSTVTVSADASAAQLTIANGGTLTVSGGILSVIHTTGSTADIDVHGILNLSYTTANALTLASDALMTLESDGVVNHTGNATAFSGGTRTFNGTYVQDIDQGVIPTATWSANSTCQINTTFSVAPAVSIGYAQTFGNFIWNAQAASGVNINWDKMAGGATAPAPNIVGTFTVENTTGTAAVLRIKSAASTPFTTMTFGGLVVTGGTLIESSASANSVTLTVSGNVTVSGGKFDIHDNSFLIVGGDMTVTDPGQVTGSATTTTFNKTGTQNITWTSPNNPPGSMTVNANSTLNLQSSLAISSAKLFTVTGTLNCGINNLTGGGDITVTGTLKLGSLDSGGAISTTAGTGNIRLTGTRTLTGANFVYNGSAAQSTGNGLVSSGNVEINNAAGVTLSAATTINNLTLTSGNLTTTAANLLTVNGTISGASSNSFVAGPLALPYSGTGAKSFPIGVPPNYRAVTVDITSLSGTPTITVTPHEPSTFGCSAPASYALSTVRDWTIESSVAGPQTATVTVNGSGVTIAESNLVQCVSGTPTVLTTSNPSAANYQAAAVSLGTAQDFALAQLCVSPSPVTSPAASDSGACTPVSVTWTLNGSASYKIYRKTGAGSYSLLASGLTSSPYSDATAGGSTTYTYAVVAVAPCGAESTMAETSPTTTSSGQAAQPAQPTITAQCGSLTVNWTTVSGAVSYNVYRRLSTDVSYGSAIATGLTGNSYADSGASDPTKTYVYAVSAVAVCEGLQSLDSAGATPDSTPSITGSPASSITVLIGSTTNLAVTASGTGLAYQWQVDKGSGFVNAVDGTDGNNSLGASFLVTNATTAMAGYQYRCVVSNTCTAVISSPSTLTVAPFLHSTNSGTYNNVTNWEMSVDGATGWMTPNANPTITASVLIQSDHIMTNANTTQNAGVLTNLGTIVLGSVGGSTTVRTLNIGQSFQNDGTIKAQGNNLTHHLIFTGNGGAGSWRGNGDLSTTYAGTANIDVTITNAASLDISGLSSGMLLHATRATPVNVYGTLIASSATISGNGNAANTFTLQPGATLVSANPNGLTGASATLNFTSAPTLSTAANYTLNGSAAQSATGLPATVNNLTIANTSGAGAALTASVSVNGTLAVNSGATLDTASQQVTVASAPSLMGTLKLEVNKTAPNTFTGSLLSQTAGTLTYGGALEVTATGSPLDAGDTLNLFDAPSIAGSFTSVTLPTLSSGMQWDTTQLAIDGSVAIVSLSLSASLPDGSLNVHYTHSVTASGGTAPYTYARTSGTLPTGLTLGSDGTLDGTPTALGTSSFTITATDAHGLQVSSNYSVTISCPTITIGGTLPDGAPGAHYTNSVTASGGTSPYTYAVTSGSTPAGLSLTSGGSLEGTPTATGSSSFTITATDANGCTGSSNYTVTVACPTITLSVITNGFKNVKYTNSVSASGGTGPYVITVTGGTLPTGLGFAANKLSGKPTAYGKFTFTLTATDANGCTGVSNYTVLINKSTADTKAPTVVIKTPKNKDVTNTLPIYVAGTTADDVLVTNVEYQLDGGAWTAATLLTPTTFEVHIASVANGSHTVGVRATDLSGNVGLPKTVTFHYGAHSFANQAGVYYGLFSETPTSFSVASAGFAKITVTAKPNKLPTFSAAVTVGGKTFSGSGTFEMDGSGTLSKPIDRTSAGAGNLTAALSLPLVDGAQTLSGTLTSASPVWTSSLDADLALVNKLPVAGTKYDGLYTVVVPSFGSTIGDGYASVTIANGLVKASGKLADGQSFSVASAVVDTNGLWPLFVSNDKVNGLYTSILIGAVDTSNGFTNANNLVWVKGTQGTTYPAGFNTNVTLEASPYGGDPGATLVLPLTGVNATTANGNVYLSNGGLSTNIVNPVQLSTSTGKNKFTSTLVVTKTQKWYSLSLSLTPTTGLLSGSFKPSDGSFVSGSIKGVVMTNQAAGRGYFIETMPAPGTSSGTFRVAQ